MCLEDTVPGRHVRRTEVWTLHDLTGAVPAGRARGGGAWGGARPGGHRLQSHARPGPGPVCRAVPVVSSGDRPGEDAFFVSNTPKNRVTL